MSRLDLDDSTTVDDGGRRAVHADAGGSKAPTAWHVLVLLWVGTMWGIQPALIKFAIGRGISELATLGLVLAMVAAAIGIVLLAQGKLFSLTRPVLIFIVLAGILEYAAPLVASFKAAEHIDAGLLTLIMSTTPIFVVGIAAALGTEPLQRESVIACFIGVAALAMIAIPENALPSRDMLPWCAVAFVAPLFYACGSIYVSKAWPKGFQPSQVAFCGSAMASVLLLGYWMPPLVSGEVFALPGSAHSAILLLALTVVVEMVCYFYLLQTAGPVFTSFSSFVMIASGFIAGMVIFDERPSAWVWGSVALFAVSLALIITAPKRDAGH